MIKTAADVLTEQIIINMNSGNAVISVFVMVAGTADFWQWRDGVFILFCGKKENFSWKNPYVCMGGS